VNRYGSATRGSGGRKRREGEDQVQRQPGHERLQERPARRHVVAEQEVQPEAGVGHQDRDDEHREQRRVGAVAAGRLAVAAGPVAGERVQQRGHAQRVERQHVDQHPAQEACERACHRPARECDPDQDEQQGVGRPAEQVERGEEGGLQDRRDEHERRDRRVLAAVQGNSGAGRFATSTSTESRDEKSTSEAIWTFW
jgi:hypothetical protein